MKFRKKPVVIDAVQWDGTESGIQRIEAAFAGLETFRKDRAGPCSDEVAYWSIGTLEGQHIVSPGDWVIRGVKGEHYPCKPDIFEMTYEPVGAAAKEQSNG